MPTPPSCSRFFSADFLDAGLSRDAFIAGTCASRTPTPVSRGWLVGTQKLTQYEVPGGGHGAYPVQVTEWWKTVLAQ